MCINGGQKIRSIIKIFSWKFFIFIYWVIFGYIYTGTFTGTFTGTGILGVDLMIHIFL